MIDRPESMEEMVTQLWYAVVGSNGDGIAGIVRINTQHIEDIRNTLPGLQTKSDCADSIQSRTTEGEKSRFRRSDLVQWALTIFVMVAVGVPAWIGIFGG